MRKVLMASAIAALAFAATGANALSPAMEAAKDKCIVGEQADGYLGIVDGAAASESIQREVRAVNQQRKAAYASLAAKNGVTIEDTAALFGERLVEGAASGECVMTQDGSWAKQP